MEVMETSLIKVPLTVGNWSCWSLVVESGSEVPPICRIHFSNPAWAALPCTRPDTFTQADFVKCACVCDEPDSCHFDFGEVDYLWVDVAAAAVFTFWWLLMLRSTLKMALACFSQVAFSAPLHEIKSQRLQCIIMHSIESYPSHL